MNRKILAALAAIMVAAPGLAFAACPAKSIQQIILYKDTWAEAPGNPVAGWRDVGNAFSAGTFEMPFDQLKAGGAVLCEVKIKVVWQTQSPLTTVGVGVFACPSLSDAANTDLMSACLAVAQFAGTDNVYLTGGCTTPGTGPRPCATYPTDLFNVLIQQGQPLALVMGSYGNGSNGPGIYDVELEMIWN